MKFINYTIIYISQDRREINGDLKVEDDHLFADIIKEILRKHGQSDTLDNIILKDHEDEEIQKFVWDQSIEKVSLLHGIYFIIEIYDDIQALEMNREEEVSLEREFDSLDEKLNEEAAQPMPSPAINGPPGVSTPPKPSMPRGAAAPPMPSPPPDTAILFPSEAASSEAPMPAPSRAKISEEEKQAPPRMMMKEEQKKKVSHDDAPVMMDSIEEEMDEEMEEGEISDADEDQFIKVEPKGKMDSKKKKAKSGSSMKKSALFSEAVVGATPQPQEYTKNLAVEYYDRMNPETNYVLKLNIADLVQKTVANKENLFTGERMTQKKEKLSVLLEDPNVLVRPLFPGCLVSPPELWTDFDSEEDELSFYITPLVKTDIEGSIDFLSKSKLVYKMELPAKVDDPRYAKTVVAYGTGVSIAPKILGWFGLDVGESLEMTEILPFLGGFMGGLALTNFIAIVGIILFIIIGIFVFIRKQASSTKKEFNLDDIINVQENIRKNKAKAYK